jgi:hypothetical protein
MRNDIYIIPFGRGQKELMIENIYNPFGRSIREIHSGDPFGRSIREIHSGDPFGRFIVCSHIIPFGMGSKRINS